MNNLQHNPIEETEMPLYGGIDLHANNSVVVLLNEQDQVIYQKRLPNHLPAILEPLSLHHGAIEGLVQVPIEKGQKNWQCGGRCFMTPARHLLGGDMQGRHSAIHIGMDDHTRAMLLLADGYSFAATARQVELRERHVRKWALRFAVSGIDGLSDKKRPGRRPVFPPVVALYVVKLACERPDVIGRSLSQWDSAELARQLVRDGVVEAISPQTVQRILAHHKLKPWRHHLWLSPQVPRDAAFAAQVHEIVTLYTRPLGVWEMVLCVDEKTSLQPRTRKAPTLRS